MIGKRFLTFIALSLALSIFAGCSTFGGGDESPLQDLEMEPASIALQKIKHRSDGDSAKIEILANGEFSYTAYSLGDPPRLAIEMPEVKSELGRTFFPFDGNLVDSVEVVRFPKVNSLRVEILLKTKVDYSIEQIKNKLDILLNPDISIVSKGSEGSIIKKDRKTRKSELEKELGDKDQRIQKNETRLQRISERLDMAENLNQSLVQKNQALKDKVKALHKENLNLSALLKDKNFEVSKYRSLNSTLAQKLKELEVQAQQLEDRVKLAEISKERKREAEAKQKKEEEDIQFEVKNRILSWRSAWTSKDIDGYMDYYSTSFRSGKFNWDKWKRDKEKKFKKNRILQVELGEIWTSMKDGYVEARFNQTFRSDRHRDFGVKTLRLIREEKDWKIVRETWKRKKGP